MPRKNDKRKLGPLTKYSPFVTRKICRLVAEGLNPQAAASLAGISAPAFDQWQRDFPEFSLSIQQAEAKCQASLLSTINQAIREGEWRAAAWVLERRWPEEFGGKGRPLIPTQREGRPLPEDYIEAVCKALGVTGKIEPIDRPDMADNPISGNGRNGEQSDGPGRATAGLRPM
jgi:hypothetical protein